MKLRTTRTKVLSKMTVFDAKRFAESEFKKKIENTNCVTTGYYYIVVSDKNGEAMLVPDYNTALQCGTKWIFKGRKIRGTVLVELCELH